MVEFSKIKLVFLICTVLNLQDQALAKTFHNNFSTYSLKLKIPLSSIKSYHKILDNHRKDVFELISPHVSFDESYPAESDFVYGEWMLEDRYITKSLLDELKFFKIKYKVIMHKEEQTRQKRGLKLDFYDKPTKINGQNLADRYYSVDEVYNWIDDVARDNSDFVQIFDIGHSHKNTSLKVLKIGYKTDKLKNAFWFDSGIHAREWTTISTVMYTINEIIKEQSDTKSAMSKFLQKYDLYFLVIANPDGYDLSTNMDPFWRKNLRGVENYVDTLYDKCYGVDLNRNFDYHWMMAGSSSDVCEEIYAGEKPASEPEVQAIQDFILSKKGEWLSFVTVHSYGGYWLHHWERNNPDFNRKQYIHLCSKTATALSQMNKSFKYKYKFGIPSSLLNYDAAGSSHTWAMMVAKVKYTFTIELGPFEEQVDDSEQLVGFHVSEENIRNVAARAYKGIREYLRSFVIKMEHTLRQQILKKCARDYRELMENFSGYWS